MAIPSSQDLTRPALRLASEHGPIDVHEVAAILATELELTDAERAEEVASGKPKFLTRVQWAVTMLAQAGLVARPRRGFCEATERGGGVLESGVARIDERFLLQYPEYRRFRAPSGPEDESSAGVGEDSDEVVVVRTRRGRQRREVSDLKPHPEIRPPAEQMHPILRPLLADLARIGPAWTGEERHRWMRAFVASIDYAFPPITQGPADRNGEENEMGPTEDPNHRVLDEQQTEEAILVDLSGADRGGDE
jgi:hypothetical protein